MRLVPALLAVTLLAAPAFAQETRASVSAKAAREFALTDADKDGAVTRAEIQARIAAMSAGPRKIDATHAKRLTDLWFGRADANKDGKVTRAEYQALLLAVFDRYDADGDGKVGGAGERAAAKAGIEGR